MVGQPPCTGRLFVNYVEARLTSWQQSFMNPRPPVLPDMPDMPDKKNKLAGSSSFWLNIPFLSPLFENSFLRPSFFFKNYSFFAPPRCCVFAGWDGSKKKNIIWSLFSLPPPSVQDSDSLCVPWMDGQNATTTYYILRTTPPISVFVSPPTWHTLQLPLFSPTFLFQHLSFFFSFFSNPPFSERFCSD